MSIDYKTGFDATIQKDYMNSKKMFGGIAAGATLLSGLGQGAVFGLNPEETRSFGHGFADGAIAGGAAIGLDVGVSTVEKGMTKHALETTKFGKYGMPALNGLNIGFGAGALYTLIDPSTSMTGTSLAGGAIGAAAFGGAALVGKRYRVGMITDAIQNRM